MPYYRRGPREWSPRHTEDDIVTDEHGDEYELHFLRAIKSKKDFPNHPEFRMEAKLALEKKEPLELYEIYLRHEERLSASVGQLLWFPKLNRGAIIDWETWGEGIEEAAWTDAWNALDALARWVWGKMKNR